MADEVSRLLYRIETAAEERKILAKRLQHYERNRIRRIVTQKKKRQALEAQKIVWFFFFDLITEKIFLATNRI